MRYHSTLTKITKEQKQKKQIKNIVPNAKEDTEPLRLMVRNINDKKPLWKTKFYALNIDLASIFTPKEKKKLVNKNLYTNGFIHNCPKLEAIQMSFNW